VALAVRVSSSKKLFRILNEAHNLFVKKNQDYGEENWRWAGLQGVLIRLGDKWYRLKNIVDSGREPNFESTRDTLIDIINYAAMGVILLDEESEEDEV